MAKEIVIGHRYVLKNVFYDDAEQRLSFIKYSDDPGATSLPENADGKRLEFDGTTELEVLDVLLKRNIYLDRIGECPIDKCPIEKEIIKKINELIELVKERDNVQEDV
jgi:hypothetical protein